jgi:hypothetical protein
MMTSSIRFAVALTAVVAATAMACSSAPDAPDTDEGNTGTVSQEICVGGRINCPPRTSSGYVGGTSGVLAPPEPPPPQPGPSFQCTFPYEMYNGQCWLMGRLPGNGPGGTYPISIYQCPWAYPVLRCNWAGYCTCWTY